MNTHILSKKCLQFTDIDLSEVFHNILQYIRNNKIMGFSINFGVIS